MLTRYTECEIIRSLKCNLVWINVASHICNHWKKYYLNFSNTINNRKPTVSRWKLFSYITLNMPMTCALLSIFQATISLEVEKLWCFLLPYLFIYSIYCTLSRFKKIITPLVKIYLFPSSICLQAANKSAVPEEYFFPMQLPRCQVLPTYVYFAFNLCLMRNKSVYNISGHIIKVYTTILPLQFTATIHYSFWRVRCLQGNR